MKSFLALYLFLFLSFTVFSQSDSTELKKLNQIRSESGVDPTRVSSRAGYSTLIYDPVVNPGRVISRISMNVGVNRWSFSAKYDIVSRLSDVEGSGFSSGGGDFKFSILNAFYVKGKHALALSGEFTIPTGKPGFGLQYFTLNPSITYSYTINPSLFLAFQPQYLFSLMKDPAYPKLGILTIRTFLAKFTKTGYFFVIEPRPVIDIENNKVDFVISPIVGKALGKGFNLIYLMEIPVTNSMYEKTGMMYQFGINKSF